MSALANAVSVLRLFAAERPELSVSDVSRLLGMPKSSASRLLKAMMTEGLLVSSGKPPRYRIGHLFFELSRLYDRTSSLLELAEASLRRICNDTRHSGFISIRDGADVLVLRVLYGTEPLRVVTPLGSRAPAFATSTGRALLARLSDAEIRALHRRALPATGTNAPQTFDDLLARVARVREAGWSEAVDEGVPGVGSVAVCVSDPHGAETLAYCVSFPADRVTETERRRLGLLLSDSARRIAAETEDAFWLLHKPRVVAA